LSIDTTVTQITEIFNKLSNMRAALEGTSRAITVTIHSHNMIGMIKRISTEHKHEVRASIEKADLEYPDKIANALEGVVSACCVPSVKPVAPVTNNINAMAAMQMANGPDEMAAVAVFLANMRAGNGGGGRTPRNWNHDVEKCNDCGVRHTGKCFAKMLADGVEPPGFSKKTEDQKARLQTRAKEIKDKGLYKDRPPNVMMAAHAKIADIGSTGYRMVVDSQAGAGNVYHYIMDRELFVNLDADAPVVTIAGIASSEVQSRGVGAIGFTSQGSTCYLTNCLYVPDIGHNLISTDALWTNTGTRTYLNEDKRIEFSNGAGAIRLDTFGTFAATPLSHTFETSTGPITMHDQLTDVLMTHSKYVTRGGGPTYVDLRPLKGNDMAITYKNRLLNNPRDSY